MKLFKTVWAPMTLALFALPFITSCSSDDDEEQPTKQRTISVVVTENPMQNESAGARSTRADITTTESFSSFNMIDSETQTDYEATKSSTTEKWTLNKDYWPPYVDNNTEIKFYAYNSGTFNYDEVNPYISFSESNNEGKSQNDLLVATVNTSYNAHNGQIPLTFDHACAAVQFKIFLNSAQTNSFVVTDIKLINVKNQGDYYYEGGWKNITWTKEWQENEELRYYQLTDSEITPKKDEDQTLPCGWLFLIPQSKSDISLSISYKINGGAEKTKVIPLPTSVTPNWVSGYYYTERIQIG